MTKTRTLVSQHIKFDANLFVAVFLHKEVPGESVEYNNFLNFAVQRHARAMAVKTLTPELEDFIIRNIEACIPPTNYGTIKNLDFDLDNCGIVSDEARALFKKQACEGDDPKWTGWKAICNTVHRKLSGRILEVRERKFRIVKRRNVLYITELKG